MSQEEKTVCEALYLRIFIYNQEKEFQTENISFPVRLEKIVPSLIMSTKNREALSPHIISNLVRNAKQATLSVSEHQNFVDFTLGKYNIMQKTRKVLKTINECSNQLISFLLQYIESIANHLKKLNVNQDQNQNKTQSHCLTCLKLIEAEVVKEKQKELGFPFEDPFKYFNANNHYKTLEELRKFKKISSELLDSEYIGDQFRRTYEDENYTSKQAFEQNFNQILRGLDSKSRLLVTSIEEFAQMQRSIVNYNPNENQTMGEAMEGQKILAKENIGDLKPEVMILLHKFYTRFVSLKMRKHCSVEVQVNIRQNQVIKELEKTIKASKANFTELKQNALKIESEMKAELDAMNYEVIKAKSFFKRQQIQKLKIQQDLGQAQAKIELLTGENESLKIYMTRLQLRSLQKSKTTKLNDKNRQKGDKKLLYTMKNIKSDVPQSKLKQTIDIIREEAKTKQKDLNQNAISMMSLKESKNQIPNSSTSINIIKKGEQKENNQIIQQIKPTKLQKQIVKKRSSLAYRLDQPLESAMNQILEDGEEDDKDGADNLKDQVVRSTKRQRSSRFKNMTSHQLNDAKNRSFTVNHESRFKPTTNNHISKDQLLSNAELQALTEQKTSLNKLYLEEFIKQRITKMSFLEFQEKYNQFISQLSQQKREFIRILEPVVQGKDNDQQKNLKLPTTQNISSRNVGVDLKKSTTKIQKIQKHKEYYLRNSPKILTEYQNSTLIKQNTFQTNESLLIQRQNIKSKLYLSTPKNQIDLNSRRQSTMSKKSLFQSKQNEKEMQKTITLLENSLISKENLIQIFISFQNIQHFQKLKIGKESPLCSLEQKRFITTVLTIMASIHASIPQIYDKINTILAFPYESLPEFRGSREVFVPTNSNILMQAINCIVSLHRKCPHKQRAVCSHLLKLIALIKVIINNEQTRKESLVNQQNLDTQILNNKECKQISEEQEQQQNRLKSKYLSKDQSLQRLTQILPKLRN